MYNIPQECAKLVRAEWEDMPGCQPVCKPDRLYVESANQHLRVEGCDECVAGYPCESCIVSCKVDKGSIRIGGGQEGSRTCTHEDLVLKEPPLCWPREPKPRCPPATSEHAPSGSKVIFTSTACRGHKCVADSPECTCNVKCAPGHKEVRGAKTSSSRCILYRVVNDVESGRVVDDCSALEKQQCLRSVETDGTPCCYRNLGFGNSGKMCLKRGDDRITFDVAPDSCAPTMEARWGPFPNCQPLCKPPIAPYVKLSAGCHECFVDPDFGKCDCSVSCALGSTAPQAWEKEKGDDAWQLECNPETGMFDDGPGCSPIGGAIERFCEKPDPQNGALDVSDTCADCSIALGNDKTCACAVHCHDAYKHVGGGKQGERTCRKGAVVVCPLNVKWSKSEKKCFVEGTSRHVDPFCCPAYVFGERMPRLHQDDCLQHKDRQSCFGIHDAKDSRPECCWNDKGFGHKGPQCVEKRDPRIGLKYTEQESPAEECSDRPPVFSAEWSDKDPTCKLRCKDDVSGNPALRVTRGDCKDCAIDDPDCVCEVDCSGEAVFFGGYRQAARQCEDDGRGLLPQLKPAPPVCSLEQETLLFCKVPTEPSLAPTHCDGCRALRKGSASADACKCSVYCKDGFLPEKPNTDGRKACLQKERFMSTELQCSSINDKFLCLQSKDRDSSTACCYHADGFSPGVKCAAKESKEVTKVPQECASLFEAVFEDLPVCKPRCINMLQMEGVDVIGCEDCYVDGACLCEVQCKQGWTHIGGGALGRRACDRDDLSPNRLGFGRSPICAKLDKPSRCELSSIRKDPTLLVPSECKSCEPGDDGCSCNIACLPGLVWDRDDSRPEGEKHCIQKVRPAPPRGFSCSSLLDRSSCAKGMEHGEPLRPCCWQESSQGEGNCFVMGDPRFDRMPEQCGSIHESAWEEMPRCLEPCRFDDAPSDFLVYDSLGKRMVTLPLHDVLGKVQVMDCETCVPDMPCPDCIVKCAEGLERYGGGPEGNRKCFSSTGDFEAMTFEPKPICWRPEPAPKCPLPQTAEAFDGPKGLAPMAPLRAHGCQGCTPESNDKNCCKMYCADGYELRDGDEGPVACQEDLPSRLYSDGRCEDINSLDQCLISAEWVDKDAHDLAPCCWREAGFHGGRRCARKASQGITLDRLPDMEGNAFMCAPTRKASYRNKPNCLARCHLEQDEYVDKDKVKSCKHEACIADGQGRYRIRVPIEIYSALSSSQQVSQLHVDGIVNIDETQLDGKVLWGHIKDEPQGWIRLVQADGKDLEEFAEKIGSDMDPCPCNIHCQQGAGKIYGSPDEGHKACRMNYELNVPVFEPAPKCSPRCDEPSHNDGTRNVTGCDCLAGEKCSCDVRCMPGSQLVFGSGFEGPRGCEIRGGKPVYEGLPTCVLECPVPSNQMRTLDTSKCKRPCVADAPERSKATDPPCSCYLECAEGHKHVAGGEFGDYTCRMSAGNLSFPATADWVGPGGAGVPFCMQQFWVEIVDASTGEPLAGARVGVADASRPDPVMWQVTERDGSHAGQVDFAVDYEKLRISVGMDNYIGITREWDRGEHCKNPSDCGVRIALAKILKHGDVHVEEDRCYVHAEHVGHYSMQATLEWDGPEKIPDLDLWVRSYECSLDTSTRYNCPQEQAGLAVEIDFLSAPGMCPPHLKCDRWTFTDKDLAAHEAKSCGLYVVETQSFYHHEKKHHKVRATTATDQDGRVVWKSDSPIPNQFAKWVFWDARYMKDLTTRIKGKCEVEHEQMRSKTNSKTHFKMKQPPPLVELLPEFMDWPSDHHISLDVDQTYGYGPETATFVNVPPGTYQIVVNRFGPPKGPPINDANPRVTIRIGTNGVFECRIPDTCKNRQNIWNVANILVEEDTSRPGKPRYRFRILDTAEEMIPLNRVSLPTVRKHFPGGCLAFAPFFAYRTYFESAQFAMGADPSDAVLQASCHGQCEPVADNADLRKCIASNR